MNKILLSLSLVALTTGCSSFNKKNDAYDAAGNQLHGMKNPGKANYYKIGKPYKVAGKWYTPAAVNSYNKTGLASWYGHGFHGRPTANGEVFDQYKLTAAHKTLPLPSILKVTNLENGRTVNVRVNDRGPFVDDRIIDLSYRAAQVLGFDAKGLAKVRLEYLPQESQVAALQAGARPEQLRGINNIAQNSSDAGYANTGLTNQAAQEFAPQPNNNVNVQPLNNTMGSNQVASGSFYGGMAPQTVPLSGTVPNRVVSGNNSAVYGGGQNTPAPSLAPYSANPIANNPTAGNQVANTGFSQSPVYGNNYAPSTQTAAPITNGKIYVQAGAFSNPESANKLVSQLQNNGQKAFVATTTVNGQQFHRVRLGPVASVNNAETLVTQALNGGAADARVVVE